MKTFRTNAERDHYILDQWAANEDTPIIASMAGVTRSTVLGVVYRARQKGDSRAASRGDHATRSRTAHRSAKKARGGARAPRLAKKSQLKAKPAEVKALPAPDPDAPESLNLRIDQLQPGQCKFSTTPHDGPADQHRFCGHPTHMGRPYCCHHMQKAYAKGPEGPTAESLALAKRDQATNPTLRKLVQKWGRRTAAKPEAVA